MVLISIQTKKPTWVNTLEAFDHIGLLFDGPVAASDLPFI